MKTAKKYRELLVGNYIGSNHETYAALDLVIKQAVSEKKHSIKVYTLPEGGEFVLKQLGYDVALRTDGLTQFYKIRW